MSIMIDNTGRLFNLQTGNTSYQLYADKYGVLLHLYYGKRIDGASMEDLISCSDVGFSGNPQEAGSDRTYSLDVLPQELPSSGVGDYRASMIELVHEDGSFAADFRFEGFEVVKGAYTLKGLPALYDTDEDKSETLIIYMKEKCSEVRAVLYYGVYESCDVITRAVRIENNSDRNICLEKALSFSMDIMNGRWDIMYLQGRHAMERTVERVRAGHALTQLESVRGTSSHQLNPAFCICAPETGEDNGECIGFCLAYSGNFSAAVQKDQREQLRVQMGINSRQFSFLLHPGESFCTPQAIMTYSAAGLTGMSHNFHYVLREHMCRGSYKHSRRPLLINNWEATYFDFNEEKIVDIARQASELGIEMLVLDDGWFGKRDDDNSGLGDWFVNENKMNGSLKQVSDKIHELGMKFGLWFEPEMISEDSDLYRSHPDWALAIPGRAPARSRNQLVLDMTREDVRDYLYERMENILSNARIEYIKWDMNRSICDIYSNAEGSRQTEVYHRYVLGVYDLLERLIGRFPELLIEGCSGGGGRFDAGMLYYCPQIWCSDNTDAINRLSIQFGTSMFYPVSTMGAHLSACPNHQTGRNAPFSARADVALAGSFGYELDLRKISSEEKELVKQQKEEYIRYYSLTHEGDYYRLTGDTDESFTAWEFVSQDGEHALLEIVKKDAQGNPVPDHVKVKGLKENVRYQCSMNGRVKSGRDWNNAGLTLNRNLGTYESMKIEFNKTED